MTCRLAAPKQFLAKQGVATQVAATLLATTGDNPSRVRTEASFAALCGASPVDASSGKQLRHRLNRGGDRQANSALWTIAMTRLAHDPRTKAYAARRTAEPAALRAALFQAGILVRDGAGVGFPGHLRIAVGTAEHNARLLEVWDGTLGG